MKRVIEGFAVIREADFDLTCFDYAEIETEDEEFVDVLKPFKGKWVRVTIEEIKEDGR